VTITVYRLTKLRYQDQIFSGLGGLYTHGRWTFRGRPVAYASESISLAVLEYTLNYRRHGWVPVSILGRTLIPDDVAVGALKLTDLPHNWFDPDPPSTLRKIGEDWLVRGATAVLKVPSAVVFEEWNYLLNPRHADFSKLVMGKPEPYRFDRRLARTRKR
jgi:RES domain-containing protein